jgi:Rrf2 family protein
MKLSRASSYALHALAFLAQQKPHTKTMASHNIAAARGIPERVLLKALKPLAAARVLKSVRGPSGGYQLAKPPEKISMLEIIEAVDGPIRGQTPFVEETNKLVNHKLDAICSKGAEAIRGQLEKVSLAELAAAKK